MNHKGMQNILRHMFMQSVMERELQKYFSEVGEVDLHRLEHDPAIKTAITDRDMLLLHIDMALDSGDVELFMWLTKELRNIEGVNV